MLRRSCFFYWLAALLLALPGRVSAQQYFNERYAIGGGLANGFSNVALTDSGYVACGQAFNYPSVNQQSLVLRFFSSTGQSQRVRYHARPGYNYTSAFYNGLQRIPGGFLIPCGAEVAGAVIPILWRLNSLGDTLWTRTYRQPDRAYFASGCRTRDGGYALVGEITITRTPRYDSDVLLIRTDSLGNVRWQQHYHQNERDISASISLTPDGGFFITGSSGGLSTSPDSYVIKTDSLGNLQWQQLLGQPGKFEGTAMGTVLADGNLLVVSTTERSRLNGYEQLRPILYKLSPQGQLLWQKLIGGASYGVVIYAVHELADGSLVVGGQTGTSFNASPPGNVYPVALVFKVCADGDSLWYRTYQKLTGGYSHNYLRDLRTTPDGGFIAAGFLFASAPDTGSNDAWAFKLDSAGYLQAGGPPVGTHCRTVGLTAPAPAAPTLRLYPNPTPGPVRVLLDAPPPRPTQLVITDALGRVVRTYPLTQAETDLDLTGLPPGLYAYACSGGGRRQWGGRLVKLP